MSLYSKSWVLYNQIYHEDEVKHYKQQDSTIFLENPIQGEKRHQNSAHCRLFWGVLRLDWIFQFFHQDMRKNPRGFIWRYTMRMVSIHPQLVCRILNNEGWMLPSCHDLFQFSIIWKVNSLLTHSTDKAFTSFHCPLSTSAKNYFQP